MPPPGMLRCVVLVRTDVSNERIASIIRVTNIGLARNVSSNEQSKHAHPTIHVSILL
jgi:hypothetical protein